MSCFLQTDGTVCQPTPRLAPVCRARKRIRGFRPYRASLWWEQGRLVRFSQAVLLWICLWVAFAPLRCRAPGFILAGASQSLLQGSRGILIFASFPYSLLFLLCFSPSGHKMLGETCSESCSSCCRTWPSKCGLNQSELCFSPGICFS